MTAKDFQPTELYWPHGFGGHRRMVARRIVYLQHVSPDVVLQGPVQGMEDLEDLILLQHTEEPVQQDFHNLRFNIEWTIPSLTSLNSPEKIGSLF